MIDWPTARSAALLALMASAALVAEPTALAAQSAYQSAPPPAPYAPAQYAPAQYSAPAAPAQYAPAQYAPPAQAAPDPGGMAYQQAYADYRAQYAQWADRNCVTNHANNIAAGAIIGGVAGALMFGSVAGWAARGAWVLFGGSLGLGLGAAVGASSNAPGCPTGYGVRSGAPPFYYGGPAYSYGQPYAPAPYAPQPYYRPANGGWVWDGYRWVQRPQAYPPPYRPY
jgi:hypothetical protein